ncbi:MAG: DNA polymerase III subunit epsilon [Cycloclasticus pugetii]|jgi:DNA polymerase-3 subunit epsilon|uniref:DNA polymerase III subunit epsilon n=1 Tax=Cycloclasticus TaxID=34067 RepID=UPI00257D1964|nr:DNA polymerase III subunit epsilon [Cycloclasticus sp.]MBV1899538.1 DNA polymerase III subunit epsilon [Cycloclasticus sp.]
MRQIILDTETTGLEPKQGHRIIEVGCVELVNRRLTGNNFHYYLNPQRDIDEGAVEVHGLTAEFLADKPLYENIAEELFEYLKGAEVIIHNAAFDVGFINHEYSLMGSDHTDMASWCEVTDSLHMARKMFPGQRNSLDALCKRFEIDNSQRTLHGALLDAEILADVYLMMTGGQNSLFADEHQTDTVFEPKMLDKNRQLLPVIKASSDELEKHAERIEMINKASGGQCVWDKINQTAQ